MRRIVFFNIAWMKYYKGIFRREENRNYRYFEEDIPVNGGSYIKKTGDAHEQFNFTPTYLDGNTLMDNPEGEYCLGFVETKTGVSGVLNQLHIERIDESGVFKREEVIDDVTVVFCATPSNDKGTRVVGWYKNAYVFRNGADVSFLDENGNDVYTQSLYALARAEDCVLLPEDVRKNKRDGNVWYVKRRSNGENYGFGSSNVWFADKLDDPAVVEFRNRIITNIDNYDGKNWLRRNPKILKY